MRMLYSRRGRSAGRVLGMLALSAILSGAPASAGQTELDLLSSYIGSWKGQGVMLGGDEPEKFTCRMNISKGNAARINYAGRCSLSGLNLSVAGTIAYVDERRRYEGIMSSNTAFSGVAIGQKSGDSITFDLKERNTDEKGQDLTIGAKIALSEGQVAVDFVVTFNESGGSMQAHVPFDRMK